MSRPLDVPVSPAATVILVDDRPELQVLLLRRTSRVVFGPDNWVFPGGRVDTHDHQADLERLITGLPDAEASSQLDVERGGLAWWLAAYRETLEEAGLLLGAGDNPGVDLVTFCEQVRSDERVFAQRLAELQITLDAGAIEEVARFITPAGSPRRFDARFFVARAPSGQQPQHDNGEIVNLAWYRPEVALDRWQRGELALMPPTVRMLACLTRFASAGEVLTAARQRLPYHQVRVADPAGAYDVLLPGDPGYEAADPAIEIGWVRLWSPP